MSENRPKWAPLLDEDTFDICYFGPGGGGGETQEKDTGVWWSGNDSSSRRSESCLKRVEVGRRIHKYIDENRPDEDIGPIFDTFCPYCGHKTNDKFTDTAYCKYSPVYAKGEPGHEVGYKYHCKSCEKLVKWSQNGGYGDFKEVE